MHKNSVIVIAGPTASGKSQLAMDVALGIGGVIVNADSMQVYRNAPILSAAPSEEDVKKVRHVLYGTKDISEESSVAEWLESAAFEIRIIWKEGKVPIVVGGTGFYIDALLNGIGDIPKTDRADLPGLAEMYETLKEVDRESYERLNPNDASRVTRAYCVFKATGKPLSKWQKESSKKVLPEAKFLVIKLVPPIVELEERIALRFDKMMEKGALEEVKRIAALGLDRNLSGMKMLGLPELMDFLEGKHTLEEEISLAKLHSRQYAKRQRTWFNNKLEADITLTHCYGQEKEVLKRILAVAQ